MPPALLVQPVVLMATCLALPIPRMVARYIVKTLQRMDRVLWVVLVASVVVSQRAPQHICPLCYHQLLRHQPLLLVWNLLVPQVVQLDTDTQIISTSMAAPFIVRVCPLVTSALREALDAPVVALNVLRIQPVQQVVQTASLRVVHGPRMAALSIAKSNR